MNWEVETAKDFFRKEIEKIKDDALRAVCLILMGMIPDYFWVVPASSSGKYHPECDLGDGGLVRHSLMVNVCGQDLVTSEMFVRDTEANRDITRVACLFHDAFKSGLVDEDGNYSNHTVFEHPRFASDFMRTELEKAEIDPLKVDMICGAIYTHMGKWCVDKYGDAKALSKPRTDFEKLVHIADYTASRKYIKLADMYNTELEETNK